MEETIILALRTKEFFNQNHTTKMFQELEKIITPGLTLDISLTCTGDDEYAASVRIHGEKKETAPLSIAGTLEEIEENLPKVLIEREGAIKKKFFKVASEDFDKSLEEKEPARPATKAKPTTGKAAPASDKKSKESAVNVDVALEGVLDQIYDDIENVKVEADLSKILAKLQELSKKNPKNVRIANMIQSAKEKLLDWDDNVVGADKEEDLDPTASVDPEDPEDPQAEEEVEEEAEAEEKPFDPFAD